MKDLMRCGYEFHVYLPRGATTFRPVILRIRAEIANQLTAAVRFTGLLPCEVVSTRKDTLSEMNGWMDGCNTHDFCLYRAACWSKLA